MVLNSTTGFQRNLAPPRTTLSQSLSSSPSASGNGREEFVARYRGAPPPGFGSPDDVPILSDGETVQAKAKPYRHVAVGIVQGHQRHLNLMSDRIDRLVCGQAGYQARMSRKPMCFVKSAN